MGGTVRLGANVRLGYLSQTHSELDVEITALDAVRRLEPTMTEERGRNLLGSLLLSGDDAFKKIKELSGGQRSRVVLARLMLQKANVLVMDEPTNHLDVASQEVLQDVLSDFDGTVLFVSHDRYLIQSLATHVWAVWDKAVVSLDGSWNDYVQWRDEQTGAAEVAAAEVQADKAKVQRKEDYRNRRQKTNEVQRLTRRLAQAEKEIHDLEARMKQINQELIDASNAGDVDKITALGLEYTQTDARLRKTFTEWETVSAGLEAAGAE
jgi:ATP-binding cassette subfamily F protein 3